MLHDAVAVQDVTVRAKIVINATGAWADALRQQQGEKPRLRPLARQPSGLSSLAIAGSAGGQPDAPG
jgi:glycerol-3-phosphate dehydrogenase